MIEFQPGFQLFPFFSFFLKLHCYEKKTVAKVDHGFRYKSCFRIRLNLDKHLRIKISDKSLTQRFDVSMTSLSSGENKI